MTMNVETLVSRQLNVSLKQKFDRINFVNRIYLQTASFMQLTLTNFVQTKQLYTSNGVKLWAGRCTSTSNGF
jgi:hypothetical protein